MNPRKENVMQGNRVFAICMLILWCVLAFAVESESKSWVHRDVWLKNEQGERITPLENFTDPYSPRKTCGTCHPYSTITSGFHFQQGFDEMSDTFNPRKSWILSPGMYGKW